MSLRGISLLNLIFVLKMIAGSFLKENTNTCFYYITVSIMWLYVLPEVQKKQMF